MTKTHIVKGPATVPYEHFVETNLKVIALEARKWGTLTDRGRQPNHDDLAAKLHENNAAEAMRDLIREDVPHMDIFNGTRRYCGSASPSSVQNEDHSLTEDEINRLIDKENEDRDREHLVFMMKLLRAINGKP